MHIPDGFLTAPALITAAVASAAALGTAVVQTRNLPSRRVPVMGLSAAFVFAAQMLNFPIVGGTSGHLIGGVLTAVLLGPSAAVLVVASVLIVQCFLFADGGVLALGANILNMGVIDSVAGYYIYRVVWKMIPTTQGRFAAIAFASWCGAVLAAVVCSGELAGSGTIPARVVLPAMVHVHMLIGLGEALITTLVIFAIWQSRPELLDPPDIGLRGFDVIVPRGASQLTTQAVIPSEVPATVEVPSPLKKPGSIWEFVSYGMVIAGAMALFVSPFASKNPDGLDMVAKLFGFAGREIKEPLLNAPIPDYKLLPGRLSENWATGLAGLLGTIVVFILALLLARILMARSRASSSVTP